MKDPQRVLDHLAAFPRYAAEAVPNSVAREMLLSTDGWITVEGSIWDINVEHLGVGVSKVSLRKRLYE